jgi:tetratricopeptide (TPR) repeat protein
VEPPENRHRSYVRIAEAYIAQGQRQAANVILDHTRQQSGSGSANPASAQLLLQLGEAYLSSGRTQDGLDALRAALETSRADASPAARARIVRRVIDATFEIGEPGFDLLGYSVQQVLVLEDLWLRVRLLTETARRYIETGNEQSVNQLVQQALPAAGSLENPYRRAAAFGLVAGVYQRMNNGDRVESLLAQANDALPATGGAAAGSADSGGGESEDATTDAMLSFVQTLLDVDRRSQALSVVNNIPELVPRAHGLRLVGASYAAADTPTTAYILFSQAVRQAEESATPSARASALAEAAQGYAAIGDTQIAVIRANEALRTLREVDDAETQLSVRERIAEIYVAAEELDLLISLPLPIEDPTAFFRFAAGLALRLYEEGYEVASGEVLSGTSGRAADAGPEAAPGLSELAAAYAQTGDTTRALSTVRLIADSAPRAEALAAVAEATEEETLTEGQQELLGEIEASLEPLATARAGSAGN